MVIEASKLYFGSFLIQKKSEIYSMLGTLLSFPEILFISWKNFHPSFK